MLKLHFFARAGAIAAVVGALVLPSAALAATAIGSLTVNASVAATCRVSSTSTVSFGAYDPTASSNLQVAGAIAIACTKNTAIISIDLDNGLHVSGTTRQMSDGTDVIAYQLFKPSTNAAGAACAYTTAWTTGTTNGLVPPLAPDNSPRSFNVCGQTTQGSNVGVGAYTDTVQVTVNY